MHHIAEIYYIYKEHQGCVHAPQRAPTDDEQAEQRLEHNLRPAARSGRGDMHAKAVVPTHRRIKKGRPRRRRYSGLILTAIW
jgi:hypothetical protein